MKKNQGCIRMNPISSIGTTLQFQYSSQCLIVLNSRAFNIKGLAELTVRERGLLASRTQSLSPQTLSPYALNNKPKTLKPRARPNACYVQAPKKANFMVPGLFYDYSLGYRKLSSNLPQVSRLLTPNLQPHTPNHEA